MLRNDEFMKEFLAITYQFEDEKPPKIPAKSEKQEALDKEFEERLFNDLSDKHKMEYARTYFPKGTWGSWTCWKISAGNTFSMFSRAPQEKKFTPLEIIKEEPSEQVERKTSAESKTPDNPSLKV